MTGPWSMELMMADFVEAANLLRTLLRKMHVTNSDDSDVSHLDIYITKSEMQRLIEWRAADEALGGEQGPEIE